MSGASEAAEGPRPGEAISPAPGSRSRVLRAGRRRHGAPVPRAHRPVRVVVMMPSFEPLAYVAVDGLADHRREAAPVLLRDALPDHAASRIANTNRFVGLTPCTDTVATDSWTVRGTVRGS
jgi:hypothetical protein